MKNATAILFLMLSVVVAFSNILVGKYIYAIFILPFLVAALLGRRASKILETFSLLILGIYISIFQSASFGVIILYVSTCWFFMYVSRGKVSSFFIGTLTALIGILSYIFYPSETASRIIHASLDAAFYFIGAMVFRLGLDDLIRVVRLEKNIIPDRTILIIDSLMASLREAMDIAKKNLKEDKHD